MTHRRTHWIVLALVFFSLSQSGRAEDWTTYMRDMTRQGHTTESLKAPLALRWIYTAERPPKRAWPGPEGRTVEGLKLKHRVRFDDVFQVAAVGPNVYF